MRHEVTELGLSGLKLHGTPTEEMMETASELAIPILFHPVRVADCPVAVRAHPEVNFILAHLGSFSSRQWRDHDRAILATQQYPNLYLETSSVVFYRYLKKAARELPADKLIFCSDGPLVDSRIELQKIKDAALESRSRANGPRRQHPAATGRTRLTHFIHELLCVRHHLCQTVRLHGRSGRAKIAGGKHSPKGWIGRELIWWRLSGCSIAEHYECFACGTDFS
jgi:hypothetical protein